MSLTAELRDPGSPVRTWFHSRLPRVERVADAWSAALHEAPTVRPVSARERVEWGTLGGAIQHRISFALSAAPPLFAILAANGLTLDPGFHHRAVRCFPTHQRGAGAATGARADLGIVGNKSGILGRKGRALCKMAG